MLYDDKKLFNTPIQAWKFGPVVPDVYKEFKGNGNNPITSRAYVVKEVSGEVNLAKYDIFTDDERKSLDIACASYGHKRAWTLVDITHKENSAWFQVYKKNTNNILIPDNLIKGEFEKYIDTLANFLLS